MYMGRSEGSLQESVLCFYHMGPGCQTQVIRLQVPLSTCRLPEGFICLCGSQGSLGCLPQSLSIVFCLFFMFIYVYLSIRHMYVVPMGFSAAGVTGGVRCGC